MKTTADSYKRLIAHYRETIAANEREIAELEEGGRSGSRREIERLKSVNLDLSSVVQSLEAEARAKTVSLPRAH